MKGRNEPETIFTALGGASLKSNASFKAFSRAMETMHRAMAASDWARAKNALLDAQKQGDYAKGLTTLMNTYAKRIDDNLATAGKNA